MIEKCLSPLKLFSYSDSWLINKVVVWMVAGRAMRVQVIQMLSRTNMTTVLVVFDDRGFTTALRLSRVMASMVNTLAGTEEREMNWLRKQKTGPKCQILKWNTVGGKCGACRVYLSLM